MGLWLVLLPECQAIWQLCAISKSHCIHLLYQPKGLLTTVIASLDYYSQVVLVMR